MVAIRVVSTATIQARSQVNYGDSPEEIELNPWDLQFLLSEYAQKGILFRKPILSSSTCSGSSSSSDYTHKTIQHLKDSLSSTLDFFRPLVGRLVIVPHGGDDDTFSIFVSCNNTGASFVHAIAENTAISDIVEPTYVPPFVHSFFPLYRSKNIEGTQIPLLAVQVTELVDGIFMACSINHCLADAKPFMDFVFAWANISRNGLNHIASTSKLASFDRWFPPGNIPRPIRIPFREIKDTNLNTPIDSNQPFPFSQRFFHFKREKIVELREKAKSEIEDGAIVSNKISSLQAVTSHVWRSVIKNQHLDPEEEVTYRFFVAVGHRISHPPLPSNYFGPTLQFSYVTMKARDLVGEGGLGKFALEMNKIVSSYTSEKITTDFEDWARNPRMPPKRESGTIGKFMGTSGSPRANFYPIDFGWGKPVAVHSGLPNPKNWKLVFDAGVDEGSFDIELYASFEMLEALARDPEFMNVVSPMPLPSPVTGISNKLAQARL
ncbi:uncharacterized acetyltransferase At3g50280-like [Prosopis cineraria]|uniref:uncharacterized acetyltransferase At3g50280-like n=1 Tax=Prosopis cineraria TaxID=364024 RepID=UPI00240FBDB4|nr:uncharacterized acetyltransferase At3g50280-like [Prosopis cineraria]